MTCRLDSSAISWRKGAWRCRVLQVAGQAQRASYFANSLCKLYPESAPVLIQSMSFVEQTSPTVENLRSTCVQRTN